MSQTASNAISRLRFALAVAAGVYPLVTIILTVLGPVIAAWPAWEKSLMIVPLVVPTMVWLIIPAIHRWLGPWLRARR